MVESTSDSLRESNQRSTAASTVNNEQIYNTIEIISDVSAETAKFESEVAIPYFVDVHKDLVTRSYSENGIDKFSIMNVSTLFIF